MRRGVAEPPVVAATLAVLLVAGLHGCRHRAVTPAPSFRVLEGRWLRPDGGYVIAIATATDSGRVEASYFNPQPIRVGRAEATRGARGIELAVVLEDENYPGSTYTLTYDPADDQLKGTYFQAIARETYQIFFVRMKP